MPVPRGPSPASTSTSPGAIFGSVSPLIAAIAAASEVKTRAGPAVAVDAVRRRPTGRSPWPSRPSRPARGCRPGRPPWLPRGRGGAPCPASMITSSGSMPSRLAQPLADPPSPLARLPPVEVVVEGLAGRREDRAVEQAHPTQVQQHLGHAAGEEHPHGRMVLRAVRERVHEPRRRAIDALPVGDGRDPEPRGVRDRGQVQHEVRRAAEGRVGQHRVLDGLVREHARERKCRARRAASGRGPSGAPCRARPARPRARARCAAAPCRAPRPRPAPSRPCRGTGSRLPACRRRDTRGPRRPRESTRPWAKRAPSVCTAPASSLPSAGSVTPPGTITPGRSEHPARASIVAGRPLSQVAMPRTPARRGSERIWRRITIAASLR